MVEWCPNCGAKLSPGKERCPRCKSRLNPRPNEVGKREIFSLSAYMLGIVFIPILLIVAVAVVCTWIAR